MSGGVRALRFFRRKIGASFVSLAPTWQGQKESNPRHAVLEQMLNISGTHCYANFKPLVANGTLNRVPFDALLMML